MKLQNTLWQANTTEANLESKLVQVAFAHCQSYYILIYKKAQIASRREPNPAERPRQAVHVLDTPSAASSTAEWSSHLQTPQAWKSTGSKAQPRFISWNSLTSGKSNINDQICDLCNIHVLYCVVCLFWDFFSHAPFPHHSMDLYVYVYIIYILDLLVSYGLLSPLKLSRNALPSICSVNLVLSSHDFKQIHGDFMWFLRISDVFLPCHTLPLESFRCL